MLLRSNGQRGELLVVVLHLEGSTVGHESAVRQADTQRGADLGAFDGVGIVVLAVHIAGQHEIVFKNLQRFPRDHVNSKKCISHFRVSKRS